METAIEGRLVVHERKELLRFVVVGSVDDGKSTLIGRLLFEGHGLYEDQIAAARRASKQTGLELDFSLFTDGLKAEREQGITIDVAYRYFVTPRRKFVVADTPGHPQYTRNMATGASTAQVAIILIDARLGVLAQSRRHAYLAALLGIPHLAVAINKMDLVGFGQATFDQVAAAFERFAAPLGFQSVTFLPISATGGDNVTAPSPRLPWYRGPTVLGYLESVPAAPPAESQPFRFPVQLAVRPNLDYRGFAGQIAGGSVAVGDEVVALPSRQRTRVIGIDTFEGSLAAASAPQAITLRLADEIDLSRGEMLSASNAPVAATQLEASLVWLADRPLQRARVYVLKHTTRRVRAVVAAIHGRVDLETLRDHPTESLEKNDIGRVTVRCHRPIFCDPYSTQRATGAFILIDAETNETVAAGMIVSATAPAAVEAAATGPVTAEERTRRFGHPGAVIRLRPENAGLSVTLERALFDRGCVVVCTTLVSVAQASAAAGAIALYLGAEEAGAGARWLEATAESQVEDLLDQLAAAV